MINSKVQERHRKKNAYVYIRQSTMFQVRHHQESTERQYALKDKALEMGWGSSMIRTMDGDLGLSGARTTGREDFKTLVAEVSMGRAGAIFALEVSRWARSCLDWHRLLELCALTETLVVDEDGCYDPADYNDGLLLGIKGTVAHAELHIIRARLHGGKRNKAKKGELRFPLPVGMSYDELGRIELDPDMEVQGAVRQVFSSFRKTGSAYGVVQEFRRQGLRFPNRAYGGVWAGKLIWGVLQHGRVLGILKNPSYAGAYVFGRHRSIKTVSPEGEVHTQSRVMPMEEWQVHLPQHHEAYISWEEFLENKEILEKNRTNGEETLLSGPAREGLALLHGLLVCAGCGRRLTVRYQGNGGLYPIYECIRRKMEGFPTCICIRCDLLDKAVCRRILEIVQPAHLEMAVAAVEELEKREEASSRQWLMRIERADYEAQLAEKRYMEIDPSNRLVAATLEDRWNGALVALEDVKQQFAQFREREHRTATPEQKQKILALAKDFPRLWNSPSTKAKDKKRMLRLLIKDITVEKIVSPKQALLHIRWQGGVCEDIAVDFPPKIADQVRYPEEVVQRVRDLAPKLTDDRIVALFNEEGRLSATGKPFTEEMIKWIRFKHNIRVAQQKGPLEMTVKEAAARFDVSSYVVYYWIERGVVAARRRNSGSPYLITIDPQKEKELLDWSQNSTKINNQREQQPGNS
jgi:DNA invertase Pin-like site-specific DNA recombinase